MDMNGNRTWDAELVLSEHDNASLDPNAERVACEPAFADTRDEVVKDALSEAAEWYALGFSVEIQTYKTTKARGRETDKSFYVRLSDRRIRGQHRLVAVQ